VDRLHQLKVFVAVVDANGLAGAARALNLSPPAVTRAIADLENQLGVRLLTRTTRVVRPTEAGARYAEDCRRILAELAEADEGVMGQHAAPRGRLTLTAPVLLGSLVVTPVLTEYLAAYPEVQASCWFLDRVVNLVDEGVDVAVRVGELPDSSLQAIRVGQVRRVIVASPDYLARSAPLRAPEQLVEHRIVSANGVTPQPEWRLQRQGEPLLVPLQPRISSTSNEAALQAARLGFGVTRLLSYQVADAVRAGELQILLTDFEPPPLPVHVVHREGRHAAKKVRAFIDLAVERLRAHPALR
jgi:DNA-binding transcriptional LysR family regulator